MMANNQSIETLQLSVRATNCLRQAGIDTVGQLMERTEVQLLRLPNLGMTTLREIREALAAFHSLPDVPGEAGHTGDNLSDVAQFSGDSDSAHDPGQVRNHSIEAMKRNLLTVMNDLPTRERSVLMQRVLKSDVTLEDLGQQFGVTRERIRQIETKLSKRLKSYLQSPAGMALDVCAQEFRARSGRTLPVEALEKKRIDWSQMAGASDSDRECLAAFIGWLAGPYVERGGWATTPDYSAQGIKEALVNARDERGWLSPGVVQAVLLGAGVNCEFHEAWMTAHRFQSIDGGWLPDASNMANRAEQLLRYRNQPMRAEDIYPFVESENERSLRNRLTDDGRFKRVSVQGHFALREWPQYDEYSGIAAEIAEEIERQGGAADPQHLIEALSARFGVKPNSVHQYLSAPMFIKGRDGNIRIRKLDEALSVRADARLSASVYLVDGCWTLRFEINADTLRGSGRPLQVAFAIAAGCQPGIRRVFRSPRDEIVVSWPPGSASGPNLGSVRSDVEWLGGRADDYLFIALLGDFMDVRMLRADCVAGAPPLERLSLLVGLPGRKTSELETWTDIGVAIGLDARGRSLGPEEIHAQLVRRNEIGLANIAREACPHAVPSILDRLEGTLGL